MNIKDLESIILFAKPLMGHDDFSYAHEEIYDHREHEVGFDVIVRSIADSNKSIPLDIYSLIKKISIGFYGDSWKSQELNKKLEKLIEK